MPETSCELGQGVIGNKCDVRNIGLLLVGLVCLFYGGNWLVRGASKLVLSIGVSILSITLTFVAIGTSMPKLLVSVQSAIFLGAYIAFVIYSLFSGNL